jgi:hypothetical protein
MKAKKPDTTVPTYIFLLGELVGTLESVCSAPVVTADMRRRMQSRLDFLKNLKAEDINIYKISNELRLLNGIKE